VKYPNAEQLLRGDVRTIKAFAQVAQPVHVPALTEIEKAFVEELDYRDEARHLKTVRENLIKAGLASHGLDSRRRVCQVPKPYLDLCTESVLVMEELKGGKLAQALKQERKALAENKGESVEDFMKEVKEEEKQAKAKGIQLQGPTSASYEMLISVLEGKRKATNTMRMIYNNTLGLFPGFEKREYQDKSVLPINHAKMIDDLIHVHGHEVRGCTHLCMPAAKSSYYLPLCCLPLALFQILVDGYFNGGMSSEIVQKNSNGVDRGLPGLLLANYIYVDPHPGNVLLIRGKDGAPQLGLIDYGSTKQLSKEKRHLFAKIVIALADDNRDEICRLMKEAG
jgi:hypothetical protein